MDLLRNLNRFTLLWLFLLIEQILCLKDVRLTIIPLAVQRGQSSTLLCQYDLERAPLYAVKWYRGTHEFYRCTPSEIPAKKVFPIGGINVDEELSNSTQVVLKDVNFNLAGNFSCEVTTESPSFSTLVVSQQMFVIELPESPPRISAERNSYTLGDTLRVNCTSPPSRPPADLSFQVNGLSVLGSKTEYYTSESLDSKSELGSLTTPSRNNRNYKWSWATLHLQLLPAHFSIDQRRGDTYLQLQCTAHVNPGEFRQSTIIQIPATLGEPVHQRVMLPSGNGVRATINGSAFLCVALITLINQCFQSVALNQRLTH